MEGFQDAGPILTSGQFAMLCNTSKATLRHYREMGLLLPVAKRDNGYMAYSPTQLADFRLIEALADSGCALSAIREYLAAPDPRALEKIISSSIESIIAEREHLLGQQTLLERTLARAARLSAWTDVEGAWRIEHCKEERFYESDLAPIFRNQGFESGVEVLGEALSMAPATPVQGTYRIDRDAFFEGKYAQGMSVCCYEPVSPKAEEARTKPAGIYLKHLRKTTLASEVRGKYPVFGEYDLVRRYIDDHALETEGDLYEEELSLYFGNTDGTVYSEISIRLASEEDR